MTTGTLYVSAFVKPAGINASSWTLDGPDHWKRKRLKFICRVNPTRSTTLRNGIPRTVSFLPMDLAREHSPAFEATDKPFEEVCNGFTSFANGDVLIAKITPCFENCKGGICANLTAGIGFGSTEFHVLRPGPEVSAKYLYYVTHSRPFREAGAGQMKGSAGQQRVPTDFLAEFVLPYPNHDEQEVIVAFLEHKLAEIDRFIDKKRRLIELLEEQRQGLVEKIILGTDTKGPRKDSEVMCLGSRPRHWQEKRAKYFMREIDIRSTTGVEELLSVSHITGVTPRSEKNITMFQAESYEGYKLCFPGDLVVNTMWAFMAALGVSRHLGIVSSSYAVYRQHSAHELNDKYLDALLRTKPYRAEYMCRSTGIRESRLRLYPDQLLKIPLLCPPADEQRQIVDRVDAESAEIRSAMANAQREITLMDEFRASLIAEAVTGKINVRSET